MAEEEATVGVELAILIKVSREISKYRSMSLKRQRTPPQTPPVASQESVTAMFGGLKFESIAETIERPKRSKTLKPFKIAFCIVQNV